MDCAFLILSPYKERVYVPQDEDSCEYVGVSTAAIRI